VPIPESGQLEDEEEGPTHPSSSKERGDFSFVDNSD
jgi:hypothetical protein